MLTIIIREERRLKVSENRVLRRILGPKTEKGTTGYRVLCNEKVHNLYSAQNIIGVIKSQ
jgi:hypothetical protein